MPRFPRIHFEGALYYVMTEGDHELLLFRDDSDKIYFFSLISDYKTSYKFRLYSIALISREAHLLIEPSPDFTISQIMHDINANYTKYYNKKYNRNGHLFKERFKAILIEKEEYLLEATRYVHRIVLKENPTLQLKDYKWSSYPCYIKIAQDKIIFSIVECDEALGKLKTGLYQAYVEEAKRNELEEFNRKLYRTPVVGTKEFMEKAKELSRLKVQTVQEDRLSAEAVIIPAKRMVRRWAFVFTSLIILFVGINMFLLKSNEDLKKAIKEADLKSDLRYEEKLLAERETLKKDLEEKHNADLVSYRAMAKRLEQLQNERKVDEL